MSETKEFDVVVCGPNAKGYTKHIAVLKRVSEKWNHKYNTHKTGNEWRRELHLWSHAPRKTDETVKPLIIIFTGDLPHINMGQEDKPIAFLDTDLQYLSKFRPHKLFLIQLNKLIPVFTYPQ